ncbi:MAG: T9SS type A sorting domain-containing protein [Bacteroidetes bacterium]|nr:T9SS type A sorting domain-containing protein [Bacteroidota bacterium]
MKRFYFVLLITAFSAFHATAQTHFITAGQTQGMIFTDYVPDANIFNFENGIVTKSLDLNHDGIVDISFNHMNNFQFPLGGEARYYLQTFSPTIQISAIIDTGRGVNCIGQTFYTVKVYHQNDTVSNNQLEWLDSFIYVYHIVIGGGNEICGFGNVISTDSNYFFTGRVISINDTSLFYVHLGVWDHYEYIFDYAIEGSDSTLIISSAKDLSSSSNISISPNPFTNQLNISIQKPFDYQITDYIGRVVLQGRAERIINTEELAAGNYLLVIKNEETYSVKKIVNVND